MNLHKLSLDTIPPLLTPLRFFLTAPLFGVLAALLLLFNGEDFWLNRWNNTNLALTHLLTIGFMLMVMMGALYQFIPVMNGQLVPGSKKLAPVIHVLMILGVLTMVSGFLFTYSVFFQVALAALGSAIGLFALSLLPLLVSRLGNQLIVYLLRLLFAVLLITLGLGLFLLLGHAELELNLSYRGYTNLHALWGMLGWVVLIIIAVSSQVIPMFYVISEFSTRYLKVQSLAIMLTLLLISFYDIAFNTGPATDDKLSVIYYTLAILLSAELLAFVFYTLHKIEQRKRKLADVTINFYRLALCSLLAVIVLWWVSVFLPLAQLTYILAILLIYGLAISVINGMLHKITSFLIFLHLQKLSVKRPDAMTLVPNMKQVISTPNSQIQFMLHLISGALLLIAVYYPALTILAAVFMLASFVWLSWCLFQASMLYLTCRKKILTCPEMSMSF